MIIQLLKQPNMFYCDKCKEKKGWPESWAKSYGKCEICDEVALCNDVPSSHLREISKEKQQVKDEEHGII